MYDTSKPYVQDIRQMIEGTWEGNAYVTVQPGYYATIHRRQDVAEVDHTDGLGTKGAIHWRRGSVAAAVQDALGMNVNDLLLVGARAFKTQAHLVVPEENAGKILGIMSNLCYECKARGIAVTGGETSIHNNVDGMDLSLTMTGAVEEKWGSRCEVGDVLIGLRSSGPHSNGFTLLRLLYGVAVPEWAVEPTRLYDRLLLGRGLPLHALMHVTGGGFSKVLAILPSGCEAYFHPWEVPGWGRELLQNVGRHTAYSTFNMGMGMVLAVAPEEAEVVASAVGGVPVGVVRPGERRVVLDTDSGEVSFGL
jgi:phosphoribosylformylglycinamidine cyclo-ligase